MILEAIIVVIVKVGCAIGRVIFGLIPDVEIPTNWVVNACNLLDWAEYFFPVHIIYQQASIIFTLLSAYLIVKIFMWIKSLL